jgi:hypothetical protein
MLHADPPPLPAPTMHDDDATRHLIEGRRLLWAGVVGTALLLLIAKHPVFIAALLLVFWGGVGGISEVARGLGLGAAAKFGGMLLACLPGPNLLALGHFILRANRALEDAPALAATPRRAAMAGAASSTGSARSSPAGSTGRGGSGQGSSTRLSPRVANALPLLKQAVPVAGGHRDGDHLGVRLKLPDGTPVPEDSLPVMVYAGGQFVAAHASEEDVGWAMVSQGDLRQAGLLPRELLQRGLRNLQALADTGPRGLQVHALEGDAWGLTLDGVHEATLVLLPALWDVTLRQQVSGEVVMAIPSRDICAFCAADNPTGIATLRQLAQRVTARGDHTITDTLFVRRQGRWQVLGAS